MSSYNGNALYGKKWAVCGDSFTPVMIRSMNPDIAEEVKQAVKIKQPARGAAARFASLNYSKKFPVNLSQISERKYDYLRGNFSP